MGHLSHLLPRDRIAAAIETMVAVLDVLDGDPDLEPNGDELDGSPAEDEFMEHYGDGLCGCPVSDPGGCEHDGREPDIGF